MLPRLVVILFFINLSACVTQYKVDLLRDDIRNINRGLLTHEKTIKKNQIKHQFISRQLRQDKVDWNQEPYNLVRGKMKEINNLTPKIFEKIEGIKTTNNQLNQSLGRVKVIEKSNPQFDAIGKYKKTIDSDLKQVDDSMAGYNRLTEDLSQLLELKELAAVKQSMALKFYREK